MRRLRKRRGAENIGRRQTHMVQLILKGDVRAAAQMLSLIEDQDPRAKAILRTIYPRTGKAHVVGVTGVAGTGKSTLIDRMTVELRGRKKKVGILTVDPTSPFSGGAVLGDRIRMRDHFLDEGVFIRSLATRGGWGGLSAAVPEAVQLLDAMGKDIVFIETIGAGQDEVEISTLAHTVVVVLTPWMGDEIQGMKAGLLEISNILVVNKADLPGVEEMLQYLKSVFEDSGLQILPASAIRNEGIGQVIEGIEKHGARLLASGDHRSKKLNFSRGQLMSLVREKILKRALGRIDDAFMERQVKRIAERELDPYTAAEKILRKTGI